MAGDGGKLSVFCFRRGELVGVETVNVPADHMASRKLMGTGRKLTLDTLQANGFSLQALMRG
jgi:3-phenylpropionate/trans-cinnamate dioxygenase ferredoxin reductase subunit